MSEQRRFLVVFARAIVKEPGGAEKVARAKVELELDDPDDTFEAALGKAVEVMVEYGEGDVFDGGNIDVRFLPPGKEI